jgi:hypothetical protein
MWQNGLEEGGPENLPPGNGEGANSLMPPARDAAPAGW